MYYIYFIRDGEDGPIKIGHAKHPTDRIKQLQVGNPRELCLLGAFEGYVKDEVALHKEFSHLKIRSEWFKPEEQLLERIAEIGTPKRMRTLEE